MVIQVKGTAYRTYQGQRIAMPNTTMYCHLSTRCLKKFQPSLESRDVTISDSNFLALTEGQMQILLDADLLETLLFNKKRDLGY